MDKVKIIAKKKYDEYKESQTPENRLKVAEERLKKEQVESKIANLTKKHDNLRKKRSKDDDFDFGF